MDIVKHIKQHIENLQNGFNISSSEQRKNLKLIALEFYFLLPNFEEIINKYIQIEIEKKQLIVDIRDGNVESLQKASVKSNAEIDVYSDDYEQPEQIEIFILNAFDNAVTEIENIESLVGLFIGIIDTLDYYENFSDEPKYWNELLEKEVTFQIEILHKLKLQETFNVSIYQKRYKDVNFGEL